MSEPEILDVGAAPPVVPPTWTLISLYGGDHHGTRFWSERPPALFRVVPEGDVYERRDEGVWVAHGTPYVPDSPSADQLTL